MREKIETCILVTIIALLVWLYAEGENVRLYTNETVPVRFVGAVDDDVLVTPSEPIRVLVSMRASSGQMQAIKQQLQDEDGAIKIPVGGDLKSGIATETVVIRDRLAESLIGEYGVGIESVDPQVQEVLVERIVTVPIDVAVVHEDVELRQRPTVEPTTVSVHLPASLRPIAQQQPATVVLRESDVQNLEQNVPHTLELPIELPPSLRRPNVALEQPTALVTFEIRKLTDTIVLQSIPVWVNAPPLVHSEYDVVVEQSNQFVRDVKLSGPTDVIEQIRTKQVKVWAELRPTMEVLREGATALPAYINTPDGVTVESPLPNVPVTVVPRKANGAAGPLSSR